MTVHSCYVEDGSGTRVEILTNDGCAVDKYILNNLEYQSPLAAGQEAHAFKFADKIVISFQCSIRLDIKRGECKRPKCPKLRKRRSFDNGIVSDRDEADWGQAPVVDIDVRSRSIDVIDPVIGTLEVAYSYPTWILERLSFQMRVRMIKRVSMPQFYG